MSVEFHDNTIQVQEALENAVNQWLEEAVSELEAQTKRNTRTAKYGNYDVKGSWDHVVDEGKKEARVGSPLEAAFWEELGTGEYALNHDGRKGWWVYVEGSSSHPSRQPVRTQQEAEQTAAYLRSKGLDAHATNGTEANRPLFKAYTANKAKIIRRFEQIMKERLK